MQTYIKLYTLTHQSCGADAARWIDHMTATAGRMGGRIGAIYWTEGRYDVVSIEEWPDEDAALAFTLALAETGAARSETLHAFAREGMARIVTEWPLEQGNDAAAARLHPQVRVNPEVHLRRANVIGRGDRLPRVGATRSAVVQRLPVSDDDLLPVDDRMC